MPRGLLAVGVLLLAVALLALGYVAQANRADATAIDETAWGHDPVTLALAVHDLPLFYRVEGEPTGLLAELFEQAPLGGPLGCSLPSPTGRVAAVNAGAADTPCWPS